MKKIINTPSAPGAIGPYSQGINLDKIIFTSGQLPIDVKTGKTPKTIEEQTAQSLENIKAILEAAGTSLEKVVKTTVFLSDMDNFAKMNKIYSKYFTKNYPARSAVQVARLPQDVLVEIEAIAYN